jgi:MtfA peptidase
MSASAERVGRWLAGAYVGGVIAAIAWLAWFFATFRFRVTSGAADGTWLETLRSLLGFIGGGMAAGAFVAGQVPRLIRARAALAVGAGAAAIFLLIIFGPGGVRFGPAAANVVMGSALAFVGILAVVIARDDIFMAHLPLAPRKPERPGRRRSTVGWGTIRWLAGLFDRSRTRRDRVRAQPFPDAWEAILVRNVPVHERLPEPARQRLREQILIFLDEKHMEGCGGIELTDEIRVTIAAQACMLELGTEPVWFPNVRAILVYPSTYVAREAGGFQHGAITSAEPRVRLGESWRKGVVVLAWDAALHGALDLTDGHNLVLHEFAHQLDQEHGGSDGTPYLEGRTSLAVWARVMRQHLDELRSAVERGDETVLDAYGATDEAEFFAVATETFFEKPHALAATHPQLFGQLRALYGQDPRAWVPQPE